ncbi:MAG: chromate efflux transporter [Campylobacterota bacterium]|nr:chromate efflux transporter [Campylobacterota bacterium]
MSNLFEIFYRFLLLGLVSFGGPMAHLGYFRNTFVEKLKWLDDATYSKLVALSQFLPGPSSSQVGFSIGLKKGGLAGGIAAFIAFTLPSFLALYFIATLQISQSDNQFLIGVITGLKLFAVVVVADAAIGMFKNFCKDNITRILFGISTLILVAFNAVFIQVIVLISAAIFGMIFLKNTTNNTIQKAKRLKTFPFILFLSLLFILPFFSAIDENIKIFSVFYESGSLVFGGGHVVLPLLEQNLGDMVDKESFLVAYSLAQAVPGPMFTIASYLGADILNQSPFLGALIATMAIFLPGFLLIISFWESFESYTNKPKVLNAVAGVNVAVVGLLAAVLINTVIPSAVYSFLDLLIVLIGLYIVRKFQIPILYMILSFIFIGIILT